MHQSGADFSLILDLPKDSITQYKFIVDGKWAYDISSNYAQDNQGNMNNIVDLRKFTPLTLDDIDKKKDDELSDSDFSNELPPKDSVIDPPPLPLVLRNIPIGRVY